MAKNRIQNWLAGGVIAVGLFIAAIFGLFAYITATTTPLHPDAAKVPSVTRTAPAPKWAAVVARAEQLARAGLTEQNLPGLSVAVGVAGEIVWAEGFGWADIDTHAGVTPETRFSVADASKALTSAAVGLLLEKQALTLDDEIHTYVPEYPKKQWPVTVRQLMAQQGGVSSDEGDEEPLLERCEKTVDGIKRFAKTALLFEPGTRYHPSSYGWILVSAAVETAAHEPFFKFMRAQIFTPAGMADTLPDAWSEPIRDRATFYFPRFAGDTKYGPEPAREGDHACFAGAGAFLSTPSDLVRFGNAFIGGKLVQPATVQLLQTEQRLTSGEATGYGLGWAVDTAPLAGQPARLAGHASKADFIGGSTYLLTFPERGLVVAVMTNTSFADPKSIALKIAEAFAGAK